MKRALLLVGFLLFNACQSKPKNKDGTPVDTSEVPKLLRPDVRRVWVPPEIQEDGKVYVDGHYKYILLKGSVWSR